MESAGRKGPRFGLAWRAVAIASLGLIACLTVVCFVEGGPARLFAYEYRVFCVRGIVNSGLGTHRYPFRRLRIEKYVPLRILGIDPGDAFDFS